MIQTIQAARGVAALAVVLFHAAAVMALPKYFGSAPLGGVFAPGDAGVYLFFVLSGFIIAHAHARDVGRPERLARYAWNRATRIYPIYWIVAAAAVCLELAVFRVLTPRLGEPAFLAGVVTLVPFAGAWGNLTVAWTLFHEMIFYLAFAAVIVSPRIGGTILVGWMLACAVNAATAPLLHPYDAAHGTASPFLAALGSPLNLLFGLGIATWFAYDRVRVRWPRGLALLGCAGFAALWAGEVLVPTGSRGAATTLAYGVCSAATLLGLTAGEKQRAWRVPGVLLTLGAASYAIYLVHFLALPVAAKAVVHVSMLPPVLLLAIVAATGVGAGLVLHVFVERPILRALRRTARGEPPVQAAATA